LLALLGAHHILHVSRIRVKEPIRPNTSMITGKIVEILGSNDNADDECSLLEWRA
jgi:hypothetical protein